MSAYVTLLIYTGLIVMALDVWAALVDWYASQQDDWGDGF